MYEFLLVVAFCTWFHARIIHPAYMEHWFPDHVARVEKINREGWRAETNH